MKEVTYAMISRPGSRSCNEDYAKGAKIGSTWVFALADGLGGEGCGDRASHIAIESILREKQELTSRDFIPWAFETAQEEVLAAQKPAPEMAGMCTTLTLLRIQKGQAEWGHIGDSRLYRFHGWSLKGCTRDHSVPQMLADMGEIRPSEIRHHPDRSRLLKVIGKPWDKPEFEASDPVPVQRKDSFLLCSDGFWEFITEGEMKRCLFFADSAENWLDRMLGIVMRNGRGYDMDNLSAVCVWIR